MEIALIVVFTLLGTAIGSFLNVCIDRLPAGKSILRPPSHCDACQHPLAPEDLIPVFSYLWLRRRCRYCQAAIPWRPFWVEIGAGLLFFFAYWQYGLNVEFALAAFYGSLFIVLGVIDLEHQLILNKIVYPMSAVALIISVFFPQTGGLAFAWPARLNGIIAGAMGFVFLLVIYFAALAVYRQEGMGAGDVKLAGLIGLVTGFPMLLVSLFFGIIGGGVISMLLLLLKIKGRKEPIPFGSFLSLATIITLLWGSGILNWYLEFNLILR